MNITTPHAATQPLQSAQPTQDSETTNPLLDEVYRLTARTSSRDGVAIPMTGGDVPSAADLIRAVWNGDVRADEYDLHIVRSQDADDPNVS